MFKETPPNQTKDNRTSNGNELLSNSEIKAFDLLVPKHKALAINPNTFTSKYSPEKIANNKKYVKERKLQFHEQGTESTKRAQILEAIMAEQIELSDWFGSDVLTILPAEYDDLHNGIDMVVEFAHESEGSGDFKYLALGVDVSSSAYNLDKKLAIIKDGILKGTLAQMDYFYSERDENAKPLKFNIPKVVIGIEHQAIQELSGLWIEAHQAKTHSNDPSLSPESRKSQKERAKNALRALAEHRVKYLILEEIKMQLNVFLRFAKEKGQDEVANKFQSILDLINLILSSKETPSSDDVFKNQEDMVFQSLTDALNDFDNL